ncbi:MAG: histidine kinase dimerization/phospho-acceptor domain-containing protein [Candidatus Krumholzibacteria bacterium]|nr:histidine kinase dimerization/phospho-acceptor domain-containing protein [Candidatus Krumholzibacteria bacterium]
MSHVLLGGDEQQLTELRCLLAKWGVTVGQLPFADDVPTVLDCDAVILQGNCAEYKAACLGAVPDGSRGAAGPAAPLIFINRDKVSAAALPSQWHIFASITDLGHELRRALEFSFSRARELRTGSTAGGVARTHAKSESYRHFLSHELRSPLTAIKTSLEVLKGALGDLDETENGPAAELKVLEIALRNVRRMHQTVEWSQDLAASDDFAGTAELQAVFAGDLADHLQEVGDVWVGPAVGECAVQTDPDILARLATQMVRTVSMACPGGAVAIRLDVAEHDDQLLHLVVAAEGQNNGRASRVCNTRLVGSADESGPVAELDRLSGFMVATSLVDSLDASLSTVTNIDDSPALVLTLKLSGRTALVR